MRDNFHLSPLYPLGSVVRLIDNTLGVVSHHESEDTQRVGVLVFHDLNDKTPCTIKRLEIENAREQIAEGVNPENFKRELEGFLQHLFSPD
ncbi:MAG: hypothetical protein ABWW63_04080 [Glaciecola sp.]|jgi:hypothetical protein